MFADLVADADRAVLANLGGEPVIYRAQALPPVPVTGIFDERYVLSGGDATEAGVGTLGPAVFLRIEDLPVDPELDEPTLIIHTKLYRVVERRPDRMGGIVLLLRLAG